MVATNDITNDKIMTKSANKNYYDNYDKIFRKQKQEKDLDDKNTPSNSDTPTNN